MDNESYSYLGRQLIKLYNDGHCREDYKRRNEYGVLLQYVLACPEYYEMNIIKEERPDFCLFGTNRIGIEITEFTTKTDGVLGTISRQNFGQGKTSEEIKLDAIKHHGRKATKYRYLDLMNCTGIDSGVFDVKEKK